MIKFSDRKYRQIILVLTCLSFMASWIPRTMYSPLIPEMSSALQLTYAQAGLLMTGFWAGYVSTQIPSGYISDRIGARRTLGSALLLIGVFSVITGAASSFLDCLVYRVLCGLAAGCIFAPATSILLRWFPPKERGLAMSLYATGSKIGAIVGFTLSPVILTLFGVWRWSFWILSVPSFVVVIAVFLFMKEPSEVGVSHNCSFVKGRGEQGDVEVSSYRLILRNKVVWFLLLATFGHFYAFNVISTWAATYLFNTFEVPLAYASLVLSFYSALGLIGGPLGGVVADRIIKRRAPVIAFGYIIMCLGCIGIPFFALFGVWAVVGLLVFVGVFGSMGAGLGIAIISELLPLEILGTASGFVNLSTMGSAVSPYVFGAVLDVTGSFNLGWVVSGVVALALVMLVIPIIRIEKKR